MGARRQTGATASGAVGSALHPGWWPSPWSAASVAAGKVSRSGLQAEGDAAYWLESRPAEGGRQVVVRARAGGAREEISPVGVSVRSRVHEYGGAAVTVQGDDLFYVEQESQQWYRVAMDRADGAVDPVRLTPRGTGGVPASRYADGRVSASGRWLVCVVERHLGGGVVRHRLAAVTVDDSQRLVDLAGEADFVAAPRPSPDGRLLAWVSWDHPSMPWDSSGLWLATVEETETTFAVVGPRLVAGGRGVSVGQPRWCADGSLLYVDDRTGWWLPYRLDPATPGSPATPLTDFEAEFHAPDWVLGQATMAELADGSLVCRARSEGRDQLVRLRPPDRPGDRPWRTEIVEQPCVSLSGVAAASGGVGTVYLLGSTPTESAGVFELRLAGAQATWRISAAPDPPASAADTSVGQAFAATTPAGRVPGLLFPPANARVPAGDQPGPPPLVVFCHGGPTAAAEPGFDPVIQFFTSRGLAVAAVDYRGSSGHGRAYRQRLRGLWGEADVEDCVQYALALGRAGLVDASRMAIRGTSAGGLTALGALVQADCFAGAASWYGVTDLEALAADTHDFESRYVDSLVGPWPAAAGTYRDRSPIHHPGRVSGRVLLLQGTDDPVVPADQSERFAAALAAHSVACRLVLFEGEAHGFRRAENVEAALTAELDFYRGLFAGGWASGSPGPTG